MREFRTYGSVRGVPGNGHPYRDPSNESYPPAGAGPGSSATSNKQASRKRIQWIPTFVGMTAVLEVVRTFSEFRHGKSLCHRCTPLSPSGAVATKRQPRAIGMRIAEQPVSVTAFRPGIDRNPKETLMQWSQPTFEDMRFGFEITMYISNR